MPNFPTPLKTFQSLEQMQRFWLNPLVPAKTTLLESLSVSGTLANPNLPRREFDHFCPLFCRNFDQVLQQKDWPVHPLQHEVWFFLLIPAENATHQLNPTEHFTFHTKRKFGQSNLLQNKGWPIKPAHSWGTFSNPEYNCRFSAPFCYIL